MIHKQIGNILDVKDGVIMHGCNAQGVMGSGVALAIKRKYPEVYYDYKEEFSLRKGLCLGQVIFTWVNDSDMLCIASAITQEFYGSGKRHFNYAAFINSLQSVLSFCRAYEKDLHFPLIGCGLAGGDWNIVKELINDCDPKDTVNKYLWTLE